jgi:hypothetical protein
VCLTAFHRSNIIVYIYDPCLYDSGIGDLIPVLEIWSIDSGIGDLIPVLEIWSIDSGIGDLEY